MNEIKQLQKYLDEKFLEIREKFAENKADHEQIKSRQDKTNGSIISLKLWKAGLSVGIVLCGMTVGYIFNDYVKTRDARIMLEGRVSNMEKIFNDNLEIIE